MTQATLDAWMAERMGLAQPLTRAALDAWQLERLRETVAYARAASPFYRSRRDWPDTEIGGLKDMARLPFTEQADLIRNDPPLLALSQSAIARAVTLDTSGTSGPPKRLYFTAEDLEATIDFFHHGMAMFTRPGDRAAIAFPAGRPGGIADGLATALSRLGAEPLLAPLSAGPVELVAWLRAAKPDVIAGPPVPLLAAARLAMSDGGDAAAGPCHALELRLRGGKPRTRDHGGLRRGNFRALGHDRDRLRRSRRLRLSRRLPFARERALC